MERRASLPFFALLLEAVIAMHLQSIAEESWLSNMAFQGGESVPTHMQVPEPAQPLITVDRLASRYGATRTRNVHFKQRGSI